jgi:hypothetical protein
MKNHFQVQGSN